MAGLVPAIHVCFVVRETDVDARDKRGVVGSFHKVSAKYMPLYVAEFQFRYDNRMNADIFSAAIKGC